MTKLSSAKWAKMSAEEKNEFDSEGQGEQITDDQWKEVIDTQDVTQEVSLDNDECAEENLKEPVAQENEELNINDYLPEEDLSSDITELDISVSTAITTNEHDQQLLPLPEHIPGTSLSAQFAMLTKQVARKSKAAKEDGRKRITPRVASKINRDQGAWTVTPRKSKSTTTIDNKTNKKQK